MTANPTGSGGGVYFYSASDLGIPIDLNLRQLSECAGENVHHVKTRLQRATAFPLLKGTKPLGGGRVMHLLGAHIETKPLVLAHLRATRVEDPAEAGRCYLKALREQRSLFFRVCRDNDPDYRQLSINELCTAPLAERLAMVLTLSQMGSTEKRPEMLMVCLTGLEMLICKLQKDYFAEGYRTPYQTEISPKTGAPFGALYGKLCSYRTYAKDGTLILAPDECSAEEKNMAESLNTQLGCVTAIRTTKCGMENREKAETLYKRWLEKKLEADEIASARQFRRQSNTLRRYLRGSQLERGQTIKAVLRTNLATFVRDFLPGEDMPMIVAEPSFSTKFLPPDALFLAQAVKESYQDITQTMVTYIKLDGALEAVSQMVELIRNPPFFPSQTSLEIICAGAKRVLLAAEKTLGTLLSTSNIFEKLSEAKNDPNILTAELRKLLSLYCPPKYFKEKALYDWSFHLPYYLRYRDGEMVDAAYALAGITALARIYHVMVSITGYRLAEREAIKLFEEWKDHTAANLKLQNVDLFCKFTNGINEMVEKDKNCPRGGKIMI